MRRTVKISSGFTLVELLTALVIVSILSVAVASMLTGAARTNLYVTSELDAVSQAECAMRRMMHNLRASSALTSPATTATANSLTVVTQPDSANGNATYTVTYALSGTNLTENDTRYNSGGVANTIVQNVTAFSVTRNSTTSPQTVTLTLTIGTKPAVTRSLTVYCRNL